MPANTGLRIGLDDVSDFVRGAAFMGAGGGGDPYIGHLMLCEQLEDGGSLNILAPAELPDDSFVASVGCMGAPTVMTEKLPSIAALELALRTLEEQTGRTADAIVPLEIGGINATVPLVLARRLGLPIVDADGMGRAFPEIQMVTFGIYGCPISPVVVTNERGDVVVVLRTTDNKQGEDLARGVVTQMGGMAQISLYPMSGADAKRTCVPDTLTLALEIGRSIGTGAVGEDPFVSLFKTLERCRPAREYAILFDGKVVDVQRETKGGFNVGVVTLRSLDGANEAFEVQFQNENTVARKNGSTVAVVPDLIVVLDRETAEPITAERIRYGQRVKVLAVTVPERMTTPEALAVFGPRAFAIDADYRPFPEFKS